jgi:CRP-like cAMP-binding protein
MIKKLREKAALRVARQLRAAAPTAVRTTFLPSSTIFARGDRCAGVMYIEKGLVRVSLLPPRGKPAVVRVLEPGAFFGEGALAGQRSRTSTAETVTAATITTVETACMREGLHAERHLGHSFRAHMLATNVRLEQDLVDHVLNGAEKRLARALLVLAHFDEHDKIRHPLPIISRNLLAEMSSNTRVVVNGLMSRFTELGYLEQLPPRAGGLHVHRSLLSVVLQA